MNKIESYRNIVDEILKNDGIESYTRYVNNFCNDRVLNKKQITICFHPPCYNKVINDNYCDIHQDKKFTKI